MKKKLITVLTILINVALLPPTIHAYELNGQAWTSTDISDLDYKIYTGCDHYSYIVTISEYAATSWEDIVDGDTPD